MAQSEPPDPGHPAPGGLGMPYMSGIRAVKILPS
jgi:hypothetical protein